MADEPVAGVSVEVGADTEGFFSALDKCGKAAENFNRRVNNAFERITGVKATQQAEILAKGLEKAGGIAKLNTQQFENLRREVERLAKAGANLPSALKFPALPGAGTGTILSGNIQTQALSGLQGQLGPMSSLLTGLTGPALAAGAAVAGFAVAVGTAAKVTADSISEFAEYSSHLKDIEASTQLSTTALQELGYVGSFAKVSVDEIGAATQKLLLKVQEGDTVFARLGLDLETLRSMRPEDIFFAVAEAIDKIQDPALKLTLAKEAFDKLGPALLPIIGNLDKLREEAHSAGVVLDEAAVKKGAEAANAFNRLDQAVAGLRRHWGEIASDVGVIGFFEQLAFWTGQFSLNMPELIARTGSLYESLFKIAALDFTGFRESLGQFFEGGRPLPVGTPEELAAAMAEARAKTVAQAEASPDFVGPAASGATLTADEEKKIEAANKKAAEAAEKAAKARAKNLADLAKLEDEIRDKSMKEEEKAQKYLMDLDQDAAAHTRSLMEEEERMLKELHDVELRGAEEIQEAERAVAEARALSLSPIEAQREAIQLSLQAKEQQIAKLVQEGKITEDVGMQAVSAYREAAQAELDWANQQELLHKLGQIAGIVGQLPGLFEAFGVSGDSALGKIVAGFTDVAQAGLGFAGTLLDPSANIFDKIGAGIGLVTSLGKAIGGLFGKSDAEKAGEIAGRVLGTAVSKGLAEAISKTSKELDIAKEMASLLHMGEAMDESGKSAVEFGDEMNSLLEAIAGGAVPAQEGIDAMGEAFGRLAEEAEAGSFEALQAMGALAQRASQLDISVPEIQEAVAAGAQKAATGVEALISNLSVTTKEGAVEQARIFSTAFALMVETEGRVAAIKAMAGTFQALEDKLKGSGLSSEALNGILGPLKEQFSLVKNEATRGALEGLDAVEQIFEGFTQSGVVDLDTFSALQGQAKAAFDQLTEGGASSKAALQAVSPVLADMQRQATALGVALDPATQALIDQAKAEGIAFPTEPLERTNILLESILQQLGGQIPAALQTTAGALDSLGGSAAVAGSEISNSFAAAGLALDDVQTSAVQASSTMVGAFMGVGDQLTSGIAAAADNMASQFVGVWDQADAGLEQFTNRLHLLDGTQISIPFDFSGTGGGTKLDLSGVPQLAGGGMAHGPKSGYLAVLHGDELVTPLDGSGRGGAGNIAINMPVAFHGVSGLNEEQLLRVVDRGIKNNTGEIATRIRRVIEGGD